jgi:hypothetical protein
MSFLFKKKSKSKFSKTKDRLLQTLINVLNGLSYDVIFIIYSYIEPYNNETFDRIMPGLSNLNLIDIYNGEIYILSNIDNNISIINGNIVSKNISIKITDVCNYIFVHNNKILLIYTNLVVILTIDNIGNIINEKYIYMKCFHIDAIKYHNMVYVLHVCDRCIQVFDLNNGENIGCIYLNNLILDVIQNIAVNDKFIVIYNQYHSHNPLLQFFNKDSLLSVSHHSVIKLTKYDSVISNFIFTKYHLLWNNYITLTNSEIFVMDNDHKNIHVYDLYMGKYKRTFGNNSLNYLSPIKIINNEIFVGNIDGGLSVWKRRLI